MADVVTLFVSNPVSSTKASPVDAVSSVLLADVIVIRGALQDNERIIRRTHIGIHCLRNSIHASDFVDAVLPQFSKGL